jgi:DNA-binding transcriptional regulator GbsR (MarR family)
VTGLAARADDQARLGYAERLAGELAAIGFPRMPARVLTALLVTEDGRLTSAELSEQLQASTAAISGAVRYLEQINIIYRVREPGSRRDHYRLYDDVWINSIRLRDQSILRLLDRFKEGTDVLGDSAAGARMAETMDFFEFINHESDLMVQRWLEHRDRRRLSAESG